MKKIQKNAARFENLKQDFLDDKKYSGTAEATLNGYRYDITRFLKFLSDEQLAVNEAGFKRYVVHLTDSGMSVNSINHYIRSVKVFLYWCMEQEEIAPFKIKMIKAQDTIKDVYTQEELCALIQLPKREDSFVVWRSWAIINFILGTAAREATVCQMQITVCGELQDGFANFIAGMPIATGVLMNIPTDMLEASTIDGASPWQSFIHIKLPYLLSVQGPALVTDFVRNVNNFNVIYLLTQDVYITKDQALASSSAKEVDLLVTWLFRLTQEQYNYKMAAVIGIMVFIICAVFTLVCFRFLNKKEATFLLTQTTVSPARRAETAAQLRRGRILRTVRSILRHLLLALLAAIWLVPILWLLVTSFSTDRGINVRQFFPASYTLRNYVNILFHPDSVAQFPRWFTNTLVVACFNCVISTCFVLMVAYALSCCRFKGRKLIQDLSVSVNLFPGVLAMIAVYFVLKYLNLTNSYAGLIMVYAGSSGLGYLICKGFFDTIPISLREAAKLDGASDARVFFQVVLPMSKPILVYTIISSFMVPWTDFVMAKMILNSGVSADWTVAIGLYNMLQKTLINNYFALFCAGGVLVSIPISILFVIMQKFYVEGITSGADKG